MEYLFYLVTPAPSSRRGWFYTLRVLNGLLLEFFYSLNCHIKKNVYLCKLDKLLVEVQNNLLIKQLWINRNITTIH